MAIISDLMHLFHKIGECLKCVESILDTNKLTYRFHKSRNNWVIQNIWTLVETGNIFLPIRNVQNQGLFYSKNKPWSLVISQISTPDFLLLSGNITVSLVCFYFFIFNNSPLYYLDKAHLHKLLTSPSTQPSLNKLCNH